MDRRILIVDDNPDILEVLSTKFEDKYQVFTADNANSGLEIKKKEGIFVVITDLKMPLIDGVKFCEMIRATDPLSIVIALTGESKVFELLKCRKSGFDDYLLKPFKDDLLFSVVGEAFSKLERWHQIIKSR